MGSKIKTRIGSHDEGIMLQATLPFSPLGLSVSGSFSIGCSLMGKTGCLLLPSTVSVLNSLTVSKPEVIGLGLRLFPAAVGDAHARSVG